MRITWMPFVFLLKTLQCSASDDSPFQLTNKATGFCLAKTHGVCTEIRWTTAERLLVPRLNKCLGVQGKSVGSEVTLYDCDETSEILKWECRNETVLALKGQELYIELNADGTAVLSRTVGPNSHLTISGTSSGACTRTYREYYTIKGNAAGRPCMFPFQYENQWYSSCIMVGSPDILWCGVETEFENGLWGYCPTNTKTNWIKHPTTGANYQLNTLSALTWLEADASCKQQSASLLSISDPHEQAYITVILGAGGWNEGYKLWTGLTLDPEGGWKWSNREPFRYLNWDSGYPLSSLGHTCGIIDGAVQYSWQSSKCNKKLGYICYSKRVSAAPTEATETGFCSAPWIPYNGHCFQLYHTPKTWSDAQLACRREGGDLVSIRNVEDQSFIVSQLGYASTEEVWIGLNDWKTEGLFEWSDHSTVRFTSWEFGEPAFSTDQEDCVLIGGENGKWADRACKEKHGFICMKTSASEPSGDEVVQNAGCKTGWKKHGSYCYFVGTETKTFDEAREDCKHSDSYLADVSTGVDNAFLVSLVGLRSEKHFWLGLSNHKHIDYFVWTNTDSVRFTHWNAEMPGHRQGCVAMATGTFAGLWDVLPCTNKEKYICKHIAEGAVLTPVPPTVPSIKCANGWNKVISRNVCIKAYLGFSNKKTWFEARDYCRAIGGDLLSFHSEAELEIKPFSYRTIWIGLSAPDPATGYVWSDGSPVNFQHWVDGQPDNENNAESCAEMFLFKWRKMGSWNDNQCEKYNQWICQIPIGVTPKPPPAPVTPDYNTTSDGWLEWKGNQYYFNQNSMAMEKARHFCKQRHGDLVSIQSEAENTFLWKQISKTYYHYWIGLTVDLDATFQWMDDSQVIFQRWDEGQPNFKNYDENCAVISKHHGFWHDYNCGYEHGSICKRSSSPHANTTVAPTVPPKGGCQFPWKKFNSKCYNIVNNRILTWSGARQKCKEMGGNLASISSRQEQVFLMSQMTDAPTTDLWIGLHSLYGDKFYWTDGRSRTYVNLNLKYEHNMDSCAVINTSPPLGIGKWVAKSCNDTNGFICLRDIDPSVSDSTEPTTSNYIKILNDSIKLVPQQMSWDAAKKFCQDDDANLASLRTEWTQTYVELLAVSLNTPIWIGLNKAQTNGRFSFVDGWPMAFAHWSENEPSRDRACVYVDVDGKWKTAYCNQTTNSVCMKSTDVPPTQPSDFPGVCPEDPETAYGRGHFWRPFRGYCYIFFTKEERWTDASVSCARHGGMLTSIEDPSEQEFIKNIVQTFKDSHESFWLGLYKSLKGEWLWLDKTVKDYTNWGADESFEFSYSEIRTLNGTWRTAHLWYSRPYICKAAKVLLPKPSASAISTDGGLTHDHRNITLAVVLAIVGMAVGTAIFFFLFKKSGRHLPLPDILTTFDNPLFFSNTKSEPDVEDTQQLIENAEEEGSDPVTI
ncbi:macrophage mannose receptor 1-like [Odontesthes bonariensis]|uniref:macrophage mannose receptor 1-like n=1 Tax=Odontesthes bonariensis TaxID=219752 RepID=UPI003F5822CA